MQSLNPKQEPPCMLLFITSWYRHPCLQPYFGFNSERVVMAFMVILILYIFKDIIISYFTKHKYLLPFVFIYGIFVIIKLLMFTQSMTDCPAMQAMYEQKTYKMVRGCIKNYKMEKQGKYSYSKHFSVNEIQFDFDASLDFNHLDNGDSVHIKYYEGTVFELEYISK